MNFYQSVFLKKNFFENNRKNVGFRGISTLSDQSNDSKNYSKKFR